MSDEDSISPVQTDQKLNTMLIRHRFSDKPDFKFWTHLRNHLVEWILDQSSSNAN